MNKKIYTKCLSNFLSALFIAGVLLLSVTGCSSSKGQGDNMTAPAGMIAIDLSSNAIPVIVNVPDTVSNGTLKITENGQGGVDITVGSNFKLTVIEGSGDMVLKKTDISTDEVKKFKRFLTDTPDAIVWESQVEGMDPEYHFYEIVKVGDKSFEVYELSGEVFTEKTINDMMNAGKSIRLKETAPKS